MAEIVEQIQEREAAQVCMPSAVYTNTVFTGKNVSNFGFIITKRHDGLILLLFRVMLKVIKAKSNESNLAQV